MIPQHTFRLAHRGDWRQAGENTIDAFLRALSNPACDGLEFDVRLSRDGVPVVIHDATLERTHGRPEQVADLSARELDDLGIPSLEDVFAAVGRRPFLDIELKVDIGATGVEVLAGGRGPELHNTVVSSFDPGALEHVARRAPAWRRWLNTPQVTESVMGKAIELGCRGLSVEWHALSARGIAEVRAADLELAAWTVRRRPTFDRLAKLGVVAVCVEGKALDG